MDEVIRELDSMIHKLARDNLLLQDERDMARGQLSACIQENQMLRERVTQLLVKNG